MTVEMEASAENASTSVGDRRQERQLNRRSSLRCSRCMIPACPEHVPCAHTWLCRAF